MGRVDSPGSMAIRKRNEAPKSILPPNTLNQREKCVCFGEAASGEGQGLRKREFWNSPLCMQNPGL